MKFNIVLLIAFCVVLSEAKRKKHISVPNHSPDSKDSTDKDRACTVFIGIDESLFIRHKSNLSAVVQLANDHVDALNRIYTSQVFEDNSYFRLTHVQVMSYKSYAWFWKRLNNNYEFNEDYLNMFTTSNDFTKYCLAFLFTNEKFEGVLGYANQETVCDSEADNTGFVSFNEEYENYSIHTFAHEVAHSFGGGHDEVDNDCTDEGYIMSEDTTIDIGNQEVFSPCSVRKLQRKLRSMNRKRRNCFIDSRQLSAYPEVVVSLCGNEIVEPGEECDCGMEPNRKCNVNNCYPVHISTWDIVFSSSEIMISCHFKNSFGFLFVSIYMVVFVLLICILLGSCLYLCCK